MAEYLPPGGNGGGRLGWWEPLGQLMAECSPPGGPEGAAGARVATLVCIALGAGLRVAFLALGEAAVHAACIRGEWRGWWPGRWWRWPWDAFGAHKRVRRRSTIAGCTALMLPRACPIGLISSKHTAVPARHVVNL